MLRDLDRLLVPGAINCCLLNHRHLQNDRQPLFHYNHNIKRRKRECGQSAKVGECE
jgi:hypothetical protein